MNRLPLHARLVAGFAAAMLVLLTAAGVFVYWRVESALNEALDAELERATHDITPLVEADGKVSDVDLANATGADWQVLVPGGTVTDRGGAAPTRALVKPRNMPNSGIFTFDRGSLLPVPTVRPLHLRVVRTPEGPWLVIAVRRGARDEALRELLLQLALAGIGSLVVATIVGDFFARAALRPVERYRQRAAEIAAGGEGLRIDVPSDRDDEVTRLGHTLNDMLAAQDSALERERRFVQDASHELRTPLTLLKARIQLTRSRGRSTDEYQAALDELGGDVERMAVLTDQLLEQAAGPAADAGDEVDVPAVVRAVLDQRADVGARVAADLPHQPVVTRIGRHGLGRVLTNLLDNAAIHGAAPVLVRVRRHDGWCVIEVSDAGPGISPDLLEQVHERFARAPEARSRPGSGLGLSLVDQLVTAAGGELRLCSQGAHVSRGTSAPVACDHGPEMTVSVLLPLA